MWRFETQSSPESNALLLSAKRVNFAEWENVQQADLEDDEVTRYIETAVMENEMDVLGWSKINKTSYPELAKLARYTSRLVAAAVKGCSVLLEAPSVSAGLR